MDTDSLDAVLQSLPVLAGLPQDVREIVVGSFVPASYTFGQAIVQEGDASDALYVLVSGRVRMLKRGENGDEISLGALRPGETFGGGFSDHTAHPATVRASGDVEVVRLDRSVFDAPQAAAGGTPVFELSPASVTCSSSSGIHRLRETPPEALNDCSPTWNRSVSPG
jgi:CRP-like cAMP-binding protein